MTATSTLIDTHIHIALNNLFNKETWLKADFEQRKNWIKEILQQYKKKNIKIIRDGGDPLFISKFAREIAKEEGIIYKTPIYAIHKKGYYGSFLGRGIENLDDFKREFKTLLEHKPDHLKIILTGIVSFKEYGKIGETTFSLQELQYMVETAKSYNLPVMIHANGVEGVTRAIEAGASTIEHGYLITERELYKMAEKGIVWVPTLAPLGNILEAEDTQFVEEKEIIKKVYAGQTANILKGKDYGLKVALGSDSGAYLVGHGSGLYDEIRHFKNLGFTTEEIQKMCYDNGLAALKL